MGNSKLMNLSGAPATNDRWAEDQENETVGRLKILLRESTLQDDMEDSPGPLGWEKIHGNKHKE